MFKEEIKSPHFWLVIVSIVLYILSMFFTPIYVDNPKADIYSNSFFMLLAGWMAVLGGGLFLTMIWLANPLYFYTVFFIMNKVKFGIVPAILCVLLAVYFMTLDSVMDGESGATTDITKLGAGFYLWISSFIVLLVAGGYLFKNKKIVKDITITK